MVNAKRPFNSEKIIIQRISEDDLEAYFVGYDIDENLTKRYRLKELVDLLQKVIPEFAFGYHEGKEIGLNKIWDVVCEAANSIYSISDFEETRKIYMAGGFIPDDSVDKKYLRRGEFGELILHLLLREFHNTIPLLSKIYFKDSDGSTVHGFDAVHVQPELRNLWLGESKLYMDGKKGVKQLICDIIEHFKADYLHREFALISKKIKHFDTLPNKDYWVDLIQKTNTLSEQLESITIPLLCTYTSNIFSKYDNEKDPAFIEDFEKEIYALKQYFDSNNSHPWKTKLNIILLLFPVKCKNELVRKLHERLFKMKEMQY